MRCWQVLETGLYEIIEFNIKTKDFTSGFTIYGERAEKTSNHKNFD